MTGDPHRDKILTRLKGGLIVSCQAATGEPLDSPVVLAAMAKAAVLGGATGIRAEGPANLATIRAAVSVLVIGLYKRRYPDSDIHITPTLADALAVARTGVEIVALDATSRPRPNSETLAAVVAELRSQTNCLLMADISTADEARAAAALGFDLVSTTMSGYTAATAGRFLDDEPDFALISACSGNVPVIAEGRISTPEHAAEALRRGAFAVVVGTAITRPTVITQRFVNLMRKER